MRGQRGQAPAIEAAVIIPGLVLLVGLVVVLAQVSLARQELRAVAGSAARAAALERTPAAGERAAGDIVEAGLESERLRCLRHSSAMDMAGLAAPLGVEAEVRVTLRCELSLRDVTLPFVPGGVELTAEGFSPVDRYRAR
ncbi:pilus assembly protein TadG-related protein [Tessaracoccus oleiagri]|uniref:Putative Flp pilus-assembly TadE/G-like n=1 Tax=Tessaracoccus oleiagri TaxID=686624 RepID=A0A1G9MJB8_9ACTN|nr:pilus assembly protein TadG-related protein [Tessaracoccus oleiagri]SDL73987.1 Putative Flp pilus-assembly TadE/G-like [Tessaracoccus oleiagri]